MSDWAEILERFKRDFAAGATDSPLPYLDEAAPADRQVLAASIDRYLEMEAPRRDWDEQAFMRSPARKVVERVERAMVGTSGEWPIVLPELRSQAKIRRSTLVADLADSLGIASGDDREKVADYYHEMEAGLLPSQGVSAKVIDALAAILGVTSEMLRRAAIGDGGMASPGPEPTMARVGIPDPRFAGGKRVDSANADQAPTAAEWDEIDRLFRAGGE